MERNGMSLNEWEGVICGFEEALEDILDDLHRARMEGVRADIRALDAFGQIDEYLSVLKRDLGI